MIKINNNIILFINNKYFNTFKNNSKNINNKNKKKYKNVTNQILHLQKLYGIEENVNYIINNKSKNFEGEDIEGEDIEKEDIEGEDIEKNIKKIIINKKTFEGGG